MRTALALALALCACADESSTIETEHLSILHTSTLPLCAGTRDDLEADAVRLSERLGLPIESPIRIEYGLGAAERCERGPPGCAPGWRDHAISLAENRWAAAHELVHAIRRRHGIRGPSSIEEGLASLFEAREGMQRGWGFFDEKYGGPAELWPLAQDDLLEADGLYISSTSIMSWLLGRYGEPTVLELLRTGPFADASPDPSTDQSAAIAWLEVGLGTTLDDLHAAWQAEAPLTTNAGQACSATDTVPLASTTVIGGTADCRNADTRGPFESDNGSFLIGTRPQCVHLESARRIRITFEAADGVLSVNSTAPCVDGGWPSYRLEQVAAGDTIELELDACDVAIHASHDDLGPLEWTATVDDLGPVE